MLLKGHPRGKAPSWKSFSPLFPFQKRVFLAFSPFRLQDFVLLSLPKPIIASSVTLIVKTIRHLTCHFGFKTLTQPKQMLDGKSRECSSCDKKVHVTSVAKESSADSVHQWFSPSGHLDRRKGCSLKRSIWQSAVVQTHKSGTLSDFTKLNLTSVSDSYHCLVVQVLLKCSTYNLQFEVAGILYGVLLDPSLPPWLSSLLKRADWSPRTAASQPGHGSTPRPPDPAG